MTIWEQHDEHEEYRGLPPWQCPTCIEEWE